MGAGGAPASAPVHILIDPKAQTAEGKEPQADQRTSLTHEPETLQTATEGDAMGGGGGGRGRSGRRVRRRRRGLRCALPLLLFAFLAHTASVVMRVMFHDRV